MQLVYWEATGHSPKIQLSLAPLYLPHLPNPQRLRCDLKILIIGDPFHVFFQRKFAGRGDTHAFVGARGAHVCEFFAAYEVEFHVVFTGAFADDLAHVDVLAGVDEERASVLEAVDFVGASLAGFPANQ